MTRTPRRAPTATRATTRWPSARPARRRGRRARTAARRTTPTRTRAEPRATPTTTTARCCGSGRWRTSRPGTQPGVGQHVRAADRALAERPEPVQRHRGRRRARPSPRSTRWACVTRAASRSTRRPTSPYTAWVGPDAGSPSATQGPSTYENAAQISRAANYGWPYCMGSKQAYRDRIADGSLRTDSPAGYVPGGPATGGTEGWYDCDNLRNDSPNNTGLVEFPHATGTGTDAGKVRGNNLWWSRGNPGNANGCPEFPRRARARGPTGRPELRRHADPGLPVRQRPGPDGHERPGLPLRVRRGQLAPLARSTGTAAGSCTTTAAPASSTACCWTRRPTRTPACRSTPTACATRCRGRAPTWTPSSALTARCTCRPTTASSAPGPNVGIYRYDYVGGAPTPGANPRAFAIGACGVRFSSAGSGGVVVGVGLR